MTRSRKPGRFIPLSRPSVGPAERKAVDAALRAGALVGRGVIGAALEKRMAARLRTRHALLTTSGTHALELAMAVLGLGPGDEVILPSFTFPSVANCVLRQGATPVFADVTLDTLNLDVADVARRITRRTKAIIAVHYAGVAADLDGLGRLARPRGIAIVEDAAHAPGASYRGRALGTIGAAGCMSFHATKNITCGEGGALLTASDALARKAELFREKGTNRSAFLRGEVKKYTWVSEGSSFVLSDVLAAILAEQWTRLERFNAQRERVYRLYMEGLAPLESAGRVLLPRIPPGCRSSYHLFHMLLPTPRRRDQVLTRLKQAGVGATFHYQSLHDSPFARRSLGRRERLPVSERAGATLLRLPLYAGLSASDAEYVLDQARRALSSL